METQRFEDAETFPTRRSLRESQKRTGVSSRSPRGLRKKLSYFPRIAILGCLAAATTIVPLNGFPAMPASADNGVQYESNDVLDVLMDGVEEDFVEPDSEALSADPLVGARAAMTSSRSDQRSIPTCADVDDGANGTAAAEVEVEVPDLIMPLAEGTYRHTSPYGNRFLWGRSSMHAGIDLAAPSGTPIHSIADGVVEYTGPGKDGRSSMLIVVRHEINGETIRSWYVHMYSNGVYTTPGQEVKAGQVIGAVGSNGNSTGPHLHLEIHLDDALTTTDPASWLAANGAVPLDQELRDCLEQ